jgi:lipoyl(octanoyl) transferase
MNFADWGLIDYQEAWDKQRDIAAQALAAKGTTHDASQIIFCEHPHVYTLGRHGKANNLLIDADFLQKINATYYHVDRGGDITYHGPGQIVCYPVVDLEQLHCSLKNYIFNLEEIVILTLRHYDIEAARLTGATGVWIDADKPTARKICAIGVHASHFITTHGFAFNVNTDLNYYHHINPCGFTDKGVTSIAQETGKPADTATVKALLRQYFEEILRQKKTHQNI